MACFKQFLNDLANNRFTDDFTEKLVCSPSKDENYYFDFGDRWCSVENLINDSIDAKEKLRSFAYLGLDPNYSFSAENLKAQYIPDEDFINEGTAIVVFSIVGSDWLYTVRLRKQNYLLKKLANNVHKK